MGIKEYQVEKYETSRQAAIVSFPKEFTAQINGNEPLEELIAEVKEKILLGNPECAPYDYEEPAFPNDAEIIDKGKCVDENDGVAAFVLLRKKRGSRDHYVGALIGLRKDGKSLRGKVLEIQSNDVDNFSLRIESIENGVMKYEVTNLEYLPDWFWEDQADLKEV